jgi:pyrimidine operon attenuation protein/uracil phosphoribosyltransferase
VGTPKQHDARSISAAIDALVASLLRRHTSTPNLLLLGIANGGVVLARRIAAALKESGVAAGTGTLDISFHRDDIGRNPIPKEFSPTIIPHDVNGATVILIDDVLHSGRSVKAALDELFDHGRPAKVELAVLCDRGGRLLPIAADYVGLKLPAPDDRRVRVHLDPADPARDSISVGPLAAKPKAKIQNPKSSRVLA